MNSKLVRFVLFVTCFCVIITTTKPATASTGLGTSMLVIILIESVFVAGGLVTSIGNAVYAGRGQRANKVWLATGYLCGALNLGWGSFWLTRGTDAGVLAIGLTHVGLGAFGIGTTAWTHSRSRHVSAQKGLRVGPMIFVGSKGSRGFGLRMGYTY